MLSKLQQNDTACKWVTEKVIEVPRTADFRDYSDIDVHGDSGPVSRIAITSQEDAAIWIGHIDLEKFDFVGDGEVLHFPRSTGDCEERYCNIEGVQFIDECALVVLFVSVTDSLSDHCWCVVRGFLKACATMSCHSRTHCSGNWLQVLPAWLSRLSILPVTST